jgi:hypothetical protein
MARRKRNPAVAARQIEPRFPFTYRCPARLIGPLNEARFDLREPSRTSLVTKAIVAYLAARGIAVPESSTAA